MKLTADDRFTFELFAYGGDRRSLLYQTGDGEAPRSSVAEVWPGDIYYQKALKAHLFRIGYQTVLWQEGIGFSYTNIVNARDFRNSPFDPPQWLNRSAPMFNWLWSSRSLSVQLLYLPTLQRDIQMPFSRLGIDPPFSSQFNQVTIQSQDDGSGSGEVGGRVSYSGEGFDLSAFAFSLHDRSPYYELSTQSTLTNLVLETRHRKKGVWGGSGSFEAAGYLLRVEALQWQNRDFNFINENRLDRFEAQDTAVTFIVDSPSEGNWTYSLQYSQSTLSQNPLTSLREEQESFATLALSYDLKSSRKLGLTLLHFMHDQSLFSRLSYIWRVARNIDGSIAWDTRSGPPNSLGEAQKDLGNLFLQVRAVF